jgi:hypothetical protein
MSGLALAAGFFLAMPVLGLQALLAGCPRWLTGAALFGKPGRRGNKRFQPAISPFQIGPLGTFLIDMYDYFIFIGNAVRQQLPYTGQFGFIKPINIGNPQPQRHFGVNLINILPSRPARPGKAYKRRVTDRSP